MDINQLVKLGAQAFMNSNGSGSAGSNLDLGTLTKALTGLLGGNNGLDISSLITGMQSGGMGGMLQSWLGDGGNDAISGSQVSQLLGSEKISAFAGQLNISEDDAIGGLQDALPQMLDKASSGGSLLDSIGGMSGAMGLAGKLFG